MNRNKIIDRARKLFAMSNDASSPEEAMIAARRVRSLMESEGITIEEIQAATAANMDPTDSQRGSHKYKNMPQWYSILSFGIAIYCDCQPRRNNGQVVYDGVGEDPTIATMMTDYLVEVIERGAERHCIEYQAEHGFASSRTLKGDFRKGFATAMQVRMKELVKAQTPTGKGLVVVKQQLIRNKFGLVRSKRINMNYRSGDSFTAGENAARRTSLARQVSGNSGRKSIA